MESKYLGPLFPTFFRSSLSTTVCITANWIGIEVSMNNPTNLCLYIFWLVLLSILGLELSTSSSNYIDILTKKKHADHTRSMEFIYKNRPQIYTRDTRLPIPPVMTSSAMGLNLGLQIFADHARKSKCKTNVLTIFACHMASNVWLSSCSDRSSCR